VDSAAQHLKGRTLAGGWYVEERVLLPDSHTGSAFSVGYIVRNADNQRGFLKAFDYVLAFAGGDPTTELNMLTTAYLAERDLIQWCNGKGLSRIVRSLAADTTRVEGYSPNLVNYLIFEAADQDARLTMAQADPADQVPRLGLAHHAAVALVQLHSNAVTHQDVKPSNLLVWNHGDSQNRTSRYNGKLGDLGCAHKPDLPSPHDEKPIVGDRAYVTPEQLYKCPVSMVQPLRRQANDMFMFGNLLVYLMASVTYNELLFSELDPSQHWKQFGGTFEDVLPGLVDAHGRVLVTLRTVLLPQIVDELVKMIGQLCNPDPTRRGDPVAISRGQNPYDLRRFVTRLDLLKARAEIEVRSAS
jgi:hypothetical protein